MQLITEEIRHRLLRNAHEPDPGDQLPVCKLFDPAGSAIWLLTRMDPEHPHRLFGLCDLGLGCPEVGTVDLRELKSARGALGLPIERDLNFRARHGLAVYARAAHTKGRITESDGALEIAHAAIANERAGRKASSGP